MFTGGVGERSPEVRARTTSGLGFLGVGLDEERNNLPESDMLVGADRAPVQTLVLAAREDLEIARQARTVLEPA